MDLSKKIKIDANVEISYGTLLFAFLIVLFEFLVMWSANNWIITPYMFVSIATMLTALRRNGEAVEILKEAKAKKEPIITS